MRSKEVNATNQQHDELKVFISSRESTCGECKENLGAKAWICLNRNKGALCLSCADLDHLEFLPAGDKALTVRANKYSTLSAVVLEWSRTRKRYERQGLLVEREALERAEQECLADADSRERRRLRAEEKREQVDREYIRRFADRIREIFPLCPKARADEIAGHACLKYSGRVGRSAAAKDLSEEAIRLAVRAHVRHAMTNYDDLLSKGYDRSDARVIVEEKVAGIIDNWTKLAGE
jgi:hypothetical protein